MEIRFNDTIMPRVRGLLNSIGENGNVVQTPIHSGNGWLFFHDLLHEGYSKRSLINGLTSQDMELALVGLAKVHATTSYLLNIDNSIGQSSSAIPPQLVSSDPEALKVVVEVIGSWQGCEVYAEKLQKFSRNYDPSMQFSTVNFKCLVHSNFWMDNLLFKDQKVILTGYSSDQVGSPGLDLSYLLFTSSDINHSHEEWDHLLRVYYTELIRILCKFGYKGEVPTFLGIYIDLLQMAHFALLATIELIAQRVKDHDQFSILKQESTNQSVLCREILGRSGYKRLLQPILKYCYSKGILG